MPKYRILVIDDETLMREYVEEALVRAGYEVDTAGNGPDGLEALRQASYDVLVTDLKMAPMDGLEVLRRATEECPGLHCIVMTAYGTIETAVAEIATLFSADGSAEVAARAEALMIGSGQV